MAGQDAGAMGYRHSFRSVEASSPQQRRIGGHKERLKGGLNLHWGGSSVVLMRPILKAMARDLLVLYFEIMMGEHVGDHQNGMLIV